jgi:hypothetical protein
LIEPPVTPIASLAAPVPRPPQPTNATRNPSLPAAWTAGILIPESADAAATVPVALRKERRDVFIGESEGEFMTKG